MHHHGCSCEQHTQREGSHHHHEGYGCERHIHQPADHHRHDCVQHRYLPRCFLSKEEMIQEMEGYLSHLQSEAKVVEKGLAEIRKAEK